MMGYKFKEEKEWNVGTGAVTEDIELAKKPIHGIILNCDMLGAAAAATLANSLTQFGTKIYLVDGSKRITPEWSGAELLEYQEAFFRKNVPFQDGTAADNKLALLQLVIPMGRPKSCSYMPHALLDPLVGWNPKGQPVLHVEMPADGASIDNRHVKVVVAYNDSKFAYSKAWTRWAQLTVATTGYKDWMVGNAGKLIEALLFETSEYNATLTSDAPSILDFKIERSGNDVFTEGDVPNILGAMLDDDIHADDIYKYLCWSIVGDRLQWAINLGRDTRFRVKGGVADAVKAAFAVINKEV